MRAIDRLSHGSAIASIKVTDYSGADNKNTFHRLSDVTLDVQAYELHHPDDRSAPTAISSSPVVGEDNGNTALTPLQTIALPSKSLDGLWER